MTPEKRLNQIEPIVADVAQKVDRLIEGIGQIIVEVTKIAGIEKETKKIAGIEKEVAKIAGIEKEVSKIAGIEKEVAKIAGIEKEVAKIAGIEKEVAKIPGIERTVSITAKGLAELTTHVNEQFNYVNTRFDQQQLQTDDLRQEMNLKFDAIISLLREKLP